MIVDGMEAYGKLLVLDLHDCDVSTFNRQSLRLFCKELCELIGMNPEKFEPWDDDGVPEEEKQTEPHLKGYSCVQFITTSGITIHALELLGKIYIDLFSCKEFDNVEVGEFALEWFGGTMRKYTEVPRL